jgi:hypothetical protein
MNKLTKKIALVSILTAIMFGASCLKKQNLEEDSLSNAIAAEQIADAISDGYGPINYNDMKPNEMSSIVLTQAIQGACSCLLRTTAQHQVSAA